MFLTILLTAASLSFASLSSISLGYGGYIYSAHLDKFTTTDEQNLVYRAFHNVRLFGSYKLNDKNTLTLDIPFVSSVEKEEDTVLSKNGITDIQIGLYHRINDYILIRPALTFPTGYKWKDEHWFASGNITGNIYAQFDKPINNNYSFTGSADIASTIINARIKTGGLNWNYLLGLSRSFENSSRIKAGLKHTFSRASYLSLSSGKYGDPYFQHAIAPFIDIWINTSNKFGVSLLYSRNVFGYQSKAANSISLKLVKQFSDFEFLE
jgi:hypothetical protein